jgi:hypothetical protein
MAKTLNSKLSVDVMERDAEQMSARTTTDLLPERLLFTVCGLLFAF